MDKRFHLLAAYLLALESYCKDIHYYCKDFGTHLFADVEMDDLSDLRDQLFENVMLGSHILPYPSTKYLAAASVMVPLISAEDEENNIYDKSMFGCSTDICDCDFVLGEVSRFGNSDREVDEDIR